MKEEYTYEIVLPIEKDASLIWDWRNDPQTLEMSLHQKKKSWEEFWKDFYYDYFSSTLLPSLFIVKNAERIGYLRFRILPEDINHYRKECEISINLARKHRGKGESVKILKDISKWVKKEGYDDIYAYIKENNIISQKTFESAGYLNEGRANLFNLSKKETIFRFHLTLKEENFLKNQTYIIAEAGSNWCIGTEEENLIIAKKLIVTAAKAGVDCIKFQVFKPGKLYVKNAGTSHYLSKAGIKDDIHSILQNLAMPYEDIAILQKECSQNNIDFMATCFSQEDFLAVNPYVKVHKIASYEITYPRLIELAAQSGKPLFLSTGAAELEDIHWAVNYFYKMGGKNLTLLQCTAAYPANSLNLNVLSTLKKLFNVNIGLSDHSKDPLLAPIIAVSKGAKVIEKHFTLDRKLPGPDQFFSIEPQELKEMVETIRNVEKILGSKIKKIEDEEKELSLFAKRGIQASKEIKKGERFHYGKNIEILRPGNQTRGIHPKYLKFIENKQATRDIPYGDGIQFADWME